MADESALGSSDPPEQGKFKTNVTLEKMAECESSNGGRMHKSASEKRPKPPPKPKPSVIKGSPTASPKQTKPIVTLKPSPTNKKPNRPPLPVRPPSIKKLKENKLKGKSIDNEASISDKEVNDSAEIKDSKKDILHDKEIPESLTDSKPLNNLVNFSNNENIARSQALISRNEGERSSIDIKKVMQEGRETSDSSEKHILNEGRNALKENKTNVDVDSHGNPSTKHPHLCRAMSGPLASLEKEILEKKRSISMRKEEEIPGKSISPKPMPKPRNLSRINKSVEKGRPIPLPRSNRNKVTSIKKIKEETNIPEQNEVIGIEKFVKDDKTSENHALKDNLSCENQNETQEKVNNDASHKSLEEKEKEVTNNDRIIDNQKSKIFDVTKFGEKIESTEVLDIGSEENKCSKPDSFSEGIIEFEQSSLKETENKKSLCKEILEGEKPSNGESKVNENSAVIQKLKNGESSFDGIVKNDNLPCEELLENEKSSFGEMAYSKTSKETLENGKPSLNEIDENQKSTSKETLESEISSVGEILENKQTQHMEILEIEKTFAEENLESDKSLYEETSDDETCPDKEKVETFPSEEESDSGKNIKEIKDVQSCGERIKQSKNHAYENVDISKEGQGNENKELFLPVKPKIHPYENIPSPIKEVNKIDENKQKRMDDKLLQRPGKGSPLLIRSYENTHPLSQSPDTRALNSIGNIEGMLETEQSSNIKSDISLDFKHLRIDADDFNDSDNEYASPIQHSHNDLHTAPTPLKRDTLIQDTHYQSPAASPNGARKNLFDNAPNESDTSGNIESKEKTVKPVRKAPPRPPMFDKNYNIRLKNKLENTDKINITEFNDFKQQEIQEEQENIYAAPTSLPLQDHISNQESEDLQPEYVVPTGACISYLEDDSGAEYVDPDCPVPDEKARGIGTIRYSYGETDSNASTRSSIALNNIDDSEYVAMNNEDGTPLQKIGEDSKDSSDEDGFEYMDMSDPSPSMSPVKEPARPVSNVYLQPLTQSQYGRKSPINLRPAPPPPPNRPVRKLPPPPRRSLPTDDLSSLSSDSLDGHYERVKSIRRQMGLTDLDEDYSDSDSESDDEERVKEVKETADDGRAKSKLYYIANEILTTERTFVRALKLICDDFGTAVKQMLQKDPSALPKNAYGQMFSDIELIYELDKKFLQELEERMQEWDRHSKIGDIIKRFSHFLKMYTNYIKGYDKAMAVFQDNFLKMPKFTALVKEYEGNPSFKHLKITAYMLKPIQRIPSYRLLLVDYLKHLPADDEDYEDISNGLKIVSTVAEHINESMKEGDKFQSMLKLQAKIINNKEIVKPGRYLLKEGVLFKLSRKEAQTRMFFLLTDCLFYCEHAAGHNQFKLRQELPLAGMSVVAPDTIDFIKELTIISTKRSFTLVANTQEERDEWATAIKNAIEDVSRRIGTFACKIDNAESPSSPVNPIHELGKIAPRWVPDDRATMCSICCRKFTTYNRRHHCRACGEIVCKDCSSFEAPLHYLDLEPARVCEQCYHHLYNTMMDENQAQTEVDGPESDSKTKLKRSRSSLGAKFKVVKKPKRDRKERKTLPSKLTEISIHEQDKNVSGYLWVFKKKKLKKRWFVLKDHVLYAYKAPSDPAANFTVPVLGYKVTVTGNFDADDFVFQLEHQGLKEPLVYKADSRVSADKWVSSLSQASELNST